MRYVTATGAVVDAFQLEAHTYVNVPGHNNTGEKGDYLVIHNKIIRIVDKELFEVSYKLQGELADWTDDILITTTPSTDVVLPTFVPYCDGLPVHPYASRAAQEAEE